jgi:hypothetical protein
MPFTCSICGEESTRICARCTKDACNNHLCDKCLRCSDCCECEVVLSEPTHEPVRRVVRPIFGDDEPELELDQDDPEEEEPLPIPDPEPEPEPPHQPPTVSDEPTIL